MGLDIVDHMLMARRERQNAKMIANALLENQSQVEQMIDDYNALAEKYNKLASDYDDLAYDRDCCSAETDCVLAVIRKNWDNIPETREEVNQYLDEARANVRHVRGPEHERFGRGKLNQ